MANRVPARKTLALLGIGLGLTALLAAVVFVRSQPQSVSASFPGSNGKIAFSTNRDGNSEIYVMNPDGSNPTRLTNTAMRETSPAWSPDGAKIAYDGIPIGTEQIYVMNADGGNQTRLTNDSARDAQPAWSPDGTKIAFESNRTGAWRLYLMDPDGSQQTQLTTTGNDNFGPAWSPDGSKIAFDNLDAAGNIDVYVTGADGSNPARLTTAPEREGSPNWSPDGTKLVYERNADIYVMNADGSDQVNLTNQPRNTYPAWSPDGQHIVFQSSRDGNSELYVMNPDGSQQTRLPGTTSTEAVADWQPICEGDNCPVIPTPTPCAPTGCPTPTPQVVDFSIGSDASHGASNTCDSSGAPTAVCQVPINGFFKVSLYLNQLPAGMQGGKYGGFDARIEYSGVSQAGTNASLDFTPWPDCAFTASTFPTGGVLAGCAVGVGSPGSTYLGRLMTVEFRCVADGTITLVHGGPGTTDLVDGTFAPFSEAQGTESISIDCSGATPGPPTPVPPGPLDFSIGSGPGVGANAVCDSSGSPTNVCQVPRGAPFGVKLYLHSLPANLQVDGYGGYDSTFDFTGVTPDQGFAAHQQWPACVYDAFSVAPDYVMEGCAIGIAQPTSTYTGLMETAYFACAQSGTITLRHGANNTDLVDNNLNEYFESSDETLQIDCVDPLPYPADTDADHCPDAYEATMNPMTGDMRNYSNRWDYMNPTHDGKNRLDDILMVEYQYYIDQGNPGYNAGTDRTGLGPNVWNLGPPNGIQRIDDILAMIGQYYHDCS